jgi:hypothetical protein
MRFGFIYFCQIDILQVDKNFLASFLALFSFNSIRLLFISFVDNYLEESSYGFKFKGINFIANFMDNSSSSSQPSNNQPSSSQPSSSQQPSSSEASSSIKALVPEGSTTVLDSQAFYITRTKARPNMLDYLFEQDLIPVTTEMKTELRTQMIDIAAMKKLDTKKPTSLLHVVNYLETWQSQEDARKFSIAVHSLIQTDDEFSKYRDPKEVNGTKWYTNCGPRSEFMRKLSKGTTYMP